MRNFYVISIFRGCIIGLYSPIWILFLYNSGYNLLFLGLIGTIFEVMKFIFEIPSGAIADKLGVKFNLLISFVCLFLSWMIFPFSSNIVLLTILLLTWTLSETMFSGTFEAWLSYQVGEAHFSKQLFNNTKLFILFIVIISPLSGILYKINPEFPFILAGVISIILILYLIICVSDNKLPVKQVKHHSIFTIIKESILMMVHNKRVLNIIIASFFFAFVLDTLDRYWQPYLQTIRVDEIYFGLITTIGGSILLVTLFIFSTFDKNINQSPETFSSIITFITIILIIILLFGKKLLSIISISLITIIDDLMNTLINSIINREMANKTNSMSTIFSINGASGAMGEILSGIIFGFIISKVGYSYTFLLCALILIIPLFFYIKNSLTKRIIKFKP
ncbi:MFS transporter [Staphylococcus auricularis]|uniref:MFS transporter n=1 Tax=Staphylococcus auricularis TaxID=29379 RepID=UPI003EBC3235